MSSRQIIKRSQRQRIVHAAMDAYLRWRDECDAVSDAYRRWADVREPEAEPAWRAYEAALDREEHASALYAEQINHVGELAGLDRIPVVSLEGQR
jgi:dTDP-4-dehydrorhamnose reductase